MRRMLGAPRKLIFALTLMLAAVSIAIGIWVWWQAKLNGRVDLGRKLIGRWAAEGRADDLSAGVPAVLKGSVTRVQGRHGTAWLLDGATANVSVRVVSLPPRHGTYLRFSMTRADPRPTIGMRLCSSGCWLPSPRSSSIVADL